MKKLVPLAIVLTLLVGATPAQGSGRVDPQFGTKGRVLLPSGPRKANGTALLPDGRVIVAQYNQMLAFLPSGEVDTGFGESGTARLFMPPGVTNASIADVLVDSSGRLVVVGFADHEVLVERYTADGKLDSSFGSGDGYFVTDFGLPPADPGVPPTIFVPPPTDKPELSALQATLDRSDRIVITGLRQSGWQQVKTFWIGATEPFVARLTAEGEEDREFAGGGAIQFAGYQYYSGQPVADLDDGIYLSAHRPSGTTLIHLLSDGTPDPGFGQNGGRPAPRGTEATVALDSSGDLLAGGFLRGSRESHLPAGSLIKRLRPNGSLDRSFGRGGAVALRLPRMEYGVVAAGPRGGILVGLPQRGHRKLGKRPASQPGLALARLRPDGSLDRSFGRRGLVEIPFRHGEVTLSEIAVSGTEVLLTGGWCGKGGCGGVLAKVELGTG